MTIHIGIGHGNLQSYAGKETITMLHVEDIADYLSLPPVIVLPLLIVPVMMQGETNRSVSAYVAGVLIYMEI